MEMNESSHDGDEWNSQVDNEKELAVGQRDVTGQTHAVVILLLEYHIV